MDCTRMNSWATAMKEKSALVFLKWWLVAISTLLNIPCSMSCGQKVRSQAQGGTEPYYLLEYSECVGAITEFSAYCERCPRSSYSAGERASLIVSPLFPYLSRSDWRHKSQNCEQITGSQEWNMRWWRTSYLVRHSCSQNRIVPRACQNIFDCLNLGP